MLASGWTEISSFLQSSNSESGTESSDWMWLKPGLSSALGFLEVQKHGLTGLLRILLKWLTSNWSWFCRLLEDILEEGEGETLCPPFWSSKFLITIWMFNRCCSLLPCGYLCLWMELHQDSRFQIEAHHSSKHHLPWSISCNELPTHVVSVRRCAVECTCDIKSSWMYWNSLLETSI